MAEAPAPKPTGTVLDEWPTPPCAATLGYEFVAVDRAAKTMTVRFTATEAMLNPRGHVQGGFLTAMLDDAMGSMLVVLTDGAYAPASVDLHTQFLAPASVGELTVAARLRKMTKTTAFTAADLTNSKGDILATAVQTQRLFPLKENPNHAA